MHFPGLEKSWVFGKMAKVMEKLWNSYFGLMISQFMCNIYLIHSSTLFWFFGQTLF